MKRDERVKIQEMEQQYRENLEQFRKANERQEKIDSMCKAYSGFVNILIQQHITTMFSWLKRPD